MTMPAHERSPLLKRIPSGDDIERSHVNGGLGHSSRHAENGEAVSKPEVNFIAVVSVFNDTKFYTLHASHATPFH